MVSDLHKLLGELRQFVDTVAGDNRPSQEWAIVLRSKIDAMPEAALSRTGAVTEAEIQRLTTEIARKHGCDRGTFTVCWGKVEKGLPCRCEDEARHALTAMPAEVCGLVAELRDEDFRHEMQHLRSSSEIDRLFQAAASLIQSQASRIAELEAENEHFKEIGSLAVKFRFSDDIFVESRGPGVWVVTNGSSVLNNLGEWEYEPRPSSRTDEFIDRTRLAFSDAVRAARTLLNKDQPHD